MARDADISAWRPSVAGITEVFHARYTTHAYPVHTHDAWTLLLVDDGVVRFELDHDEHTAARSVVTLLPPHVPHDGHAATAQGFRKRVLYLEAGLLDADLVGAAVDQPGLPDPARRLLLSGRPAAEVAVAAGFYDQSHLTRHFRRMLGTSPSRYAYTR